MNYNASDHRYDSMVYRRCGNSGLKLPAISLGLWHNFGGIDPFETARAMVLRAFDLGVTHFDLANNYGPPPGSAEETFSMILKKDLMPYRDELIISTKAGYGMWAGPYGDPSWTGKTVSAGDSLTVVLILRVDGPSDGPPIVNWNYGVRCAEAPAPVMGAAVTTWRDQSSDSSHPPGVGGWKRSLPTAP